MSAVAHALQSQSVSFRISAVLAPTVCEYRNHVARQPSEVYECLKPFLMGGLVLLDNGAKPRCFRISRSDEGVKNCCQSNLAWTGHELPLQYGFDGHDHAIAPQRF